MSHINYTNDLTKWRATQKCKTEHCMNKILPFFNNKPPVSMNQHEKLIASFTKEQNTKLKNYIHSKIYEMMIT